MAQHTLIGPAQTLDDVLERLDHIERRLDPRDGVAYFNSLSIRVTREINERLAGCSFENEEFIARLDVAFANLYFEALDDYERARRCTEAWEPLFEERARPNTTPIQFAIAGMNAHISHDLAFGISRTCAELGIEPVDDGPEQRDFTRVNLLLAEVQDQVKEWFTHGAIAHLDEACGRLDDALALWSIATARAIAWEQAQAHWRLRDDALLEHIFRRALARSVGLASRGILL